MSQRRLILVIVAALVVLGGALLFSSNRNQSQQAPEVPLLPSLAHDLGAVTEVTVRKGSPTPTVTLHKTGDRWTVAQRADYPADVAKIRTLLLALRDAKIVEAKTSDPAKFTAIGVEDPSQPGATGTEVSVSAPAAKFALIVGKPVGEGNFARRTGDNQTYSVEPALSIDGDPKSWIDSRLLELPVALIQTIEVKPASGSGYSLHRANPADQTYALDGVPKGRKPLDGHALAPGPTAFTGVTAEDVSRVGDLDFGQPSVVTVTLSDGNVVTLTGTVIANRHWIKVQATKDAALSAKADGRAFEIASYRYDAIFKPLDRLLEPLPAPAPKDAPASKGSPASKGAPAATKSTVAPKSSAASQGP